MKKNKVVEKAWRLFRKGKVKHDFGDWYIVEGDTSEHSVFWNGSRHSCDCQYYSLHLEKGAICSHILAVIFYSEFSVEKWNIEFLVGDMKKIDEEIEELEQYLENIQKGGKNGESVY